MGFFKFADAMHATGVLRPVIVISANNAEEKQAIKETKTMVLNVNSIMIMLFDSIYAKFDKYRYLS